MCRRVASSPCGIVHCEGSIGAAGAVAGAACMRMTWRVASHHVVAAVAASTRAAAPMPTSQFLRVMALLLCSRCRACRDEVLQSRPQARRLELDLDAVELQSQPHAACLEHLRQRDAAAAIAAEQGLDALTG